MVEVTVKPIILPPKPQREVIAVPETTEDFVLILSYYESLVQQWEAWGLAVEQSNGGK